jgi:long-chain acyl-CoA synthetase
MQVADEVTHFLSGIWGYGERIALRTSDSQEITYSDLDEKSGSFASNFLESNTIAILVCTNRIESIIAYLAFLRAGVVPILLSEQLYYSDIEKYISVYQPMFIFSIKDIKDYNYQFRTRLGNSSLYSRNTVITVDLHPELKILIPTSGSTGNPKLVRISNENLIANSKMIMSSLPMSKNDLVITTLPMSYSYGLSIINTHLLVGATIQLNEFPIIQRNFWNLLLSSNATTFGGVPYTYQQIFKTGLSRLLHSNIRYLTQAGGKLPSPILREMYSFCKRAEIDFYVMYGQTEATARMAVLNPIDAMTHFGSIGKAIDPSHFNLDFSATESIVGLHKVGELIFKGDNVAMGYAECVRDLNNHDQWEQVLRTGDLAYFDEDEFPYIVGRLSRFVKVRGIRISLDDIEHMFTKVNVQVAATQLNDEIYLLVSGEVEHDYIEKVISNLAGLRAQDIIVIKVAEIPRNLVDKIDYRAVERIAATQSECSIKDSLGNN